MASFSDVRIRSLVSLASLAALILAVLAACASVPVGQHPNKSVVKLEKGTFEVSYLLYVPAAYGRDRQAKWPLILFLHGMGECGTNLDLLTKHPLPEMLEKRKDFPFIVVSPQLSTPYNGWQPELEALNALLLQVQSKLSIDPKRVYVTGLSMGGSGTWQMALRYPRRFAAAVPVAGFWEWNSRLLPPNLCQLQSLPIWAFHGARDSSVKLWQDELIVAALRACGSSVKFTVYDDAEHEDTWREAYADPALFEWMLAQTLRMRE
jgi:predicted peptidase